MKSLFTAFLCSLFLGGCAIDGSPLATSPTTAATQTELEIAVASASLKPASSLTTARGSFVGENDHVVKGTADIFRYKGGWFVHLGKDFSLDGAPDPKVALGKSTQGGFQPDAVLAKLDRLDGEQIYALKSGLNIGNYDQVYIWSEKLNVTLGRADLTLLRSGERQTR